MALGAEQTGAKQVQPPPAYPLKKSANGRHLVDSKGKPFFLAGDAPQALMVKLTEADADLYFSNRVTKTTETELCGPVPYGISASPFSKSPSAWAMQFVTCARHNTGRRRARVTSTKYGGGRTSRICPAAVTLTTNSHPDANKASAGFPCSGPVASLG